MSARPLWTSASAFDQRPALAVITQFLSKRPAWQAEEPFAVPLDIYKAGAREMDETMEKRGFGRPVSPEFAKQGVEHFMLFGTVIVPKET